jgi:hypothetical protein
MTLPGLASSNLVGLGHADRVGLVAVGTATVRLDPGGADPPATGGVARWLLVRRRRGDGELAFYACFGPTGTSLLGLVRVAGTRWAVEMVFPQLAKGRMRAVG